MSRGKLTAGFTTASVLGDFAERSAVEDLDFTFLAAFLSSLILAIVE